jgi:hypothetical protein
LISRERGPKHGVAASNIAADGDGAVRIKVTRAIRIVDSFSSAIHAESTFATKILRTNSRPFLGQSLPQVIARRHVSARSKKSLGYFGKEQ